MSLGDVPAPGQHGCDTRSWQPEGGARCVCGASVEAEPARILGVDGVVPACPACWFNRESNVAYVTVTSAVGHFRDGTGYRDPKLEIDAAAHPEVEG